MAKKGKKEQGRIRRIPQPLSDPSGPSGQRFGLGVKEYVVGSWCPSPDGSGPATAVSIQLVTNVPDVTFFMRLKSPAAVDEMIAALSRHRDDVWPKPAVSGGSHVNLEHPTVRDLVWQLQQLDQDRKISAHGEPRGISIRNGFDNDVSLVGF